MRWQSHSPTSVDDADLKRLRGLYDALGLGFPPEALQVFGGDEAADRGDWCLSRNGRTLRCLGADELSNDELFALPATWELMRVVVRTVGSKRTKRGHVVSFGGHLYCRPRGSWGNERFPFLHIWTMCAGRALHFEDFLDGIELRRSGRLNGCPAS